MEKQDFFAGATKVNEYIARIKKGESKENIFKDLPESFRKSIENGLGKKENKSETEDSLLNVPPQYEGLPSDVLEEIWTIPVYVDEEKTKFENERRVKIIENLREKELNGKEVEEKELLDKEKIEELRTKIQQPEKMDKQENKSDFEKFSVSNGETDEGMFWYQYRNKAAKNLKNEGKFEWGKERIYFDIKMEDMKRLGDLVMKTAAENNIAIAYKFLDEEKTTDINKDGKETRFVANFATEDDAKKFMLAIKNDQSYESFISDRNLDYKGLRLDNIAEYASGFRETRSALERIMKGSISDHGTSYSYLSEAGKVISISLVDYESFKKSYNEANLVMQKKKEEWDRLLNSK